MYNDFFKYPPKLRFGHICLYNIDLKEDRAIELADETVGDRLCILVLIHIFILIRK